MQIYYIAECNPNYNSAYLTHVIKMCDSFSKNFETEILLPFKTSNLKYEKIRKKYLLLSKSPLKISSLLNNSVPLGFFKRAFFSLKVAIYLKRKKKNVILSRSILSSFFLSIFKINHYIEIHNELRGFSKFIMINLGFINSKYIRKRIFISKKLESLFKMNKKNNLILHDGVEKKNFFLKKNTRKNKKKKIVYIGSFYKGRGLEVIKKLSRIYPHIIFNVYGHRNEKISRNFLKNFNIHKFVNYSEVPKILSEADILLMPYENKVFINAKDLNTAQYCSPLKMFEYLASGKIIISNSLPGISEILKDNTNSILLNKINLYELKKGIDLALKKDVLYFNYFARKKAERYTWDNRAEKIIRDYFN
ncbi:glycosyltransferase [Candidatus Pelagibacter sp.]|uniref:glycosyltransferase n=1 Tax=Candidatus Pelagibacter sp. TaxID=2024849 RepID=UPI003F826FF5